MAEGRVGASIGSGLLCIRVVDFERHDEAARQRGQTIVAQAFDEYKSSISVAEHDGDDVSASVDLEVEDQGSPSSRGATQVLVCVGTEKEQVDQAIEDLAKKVLKDHKATVVAAGIETFMTYDRKFREFVTTWVIRNRPLSVFSGASSADQRRTGRSQRSCSFVERHDIDRRSVVT